MTRKERIEKAERAVIDAAKDLQHSGLSRDIGDVARAVNLLKKAEASGPPDLSTYHTPNSARYGAAEVLRALADAPGFCVTLAREWADELEEQ